MKIKPPKWPGYMLNFVVEVNANPAPRGFWNFSSLLYAHVKATPWDLTKSEMFHADSGHCSRCILRRLVEVREVGNREDDAAMKWRTISASRFLLIEPMHRYLLESMALGNGWGGM